MARYDYESTQQYAEQKFSDAKQYNEEQAKKQEKFFKRLLGLKTFVKGANALINQNADKLESSFGPAKAKYKSYIQNAEATTTYWNEVQKNGGVDYLQKQIYDSYLSSAKEVKPFDEVKNISGWIYDEATTKANELYSTLEQKATQAKDVPTMKDFMDDYENFTDIQAPRTLFGAATKGIKRILSRENAETLEYKKGIAKNKLFNTDVIKEIDEFAGFADTYDKLGYDTPELIKKMNEQFVEGKQGVIGKKIKSSTIEKFDLGNTLKVISFIEYEDGTNAKPKVLAEEKKNDMSSTIQDVNLVSMVSNIKDEKVNDFIKILNGTGNTALKTNTSAAYIWAIENDAIKINLDDAKKANDLVDNIYQDVIQGKFTKEGMPMFEQDINTKEYRVRPEFLSQAKVEEWDAETFKQTQLDKLGINYKFNQELESTASKGTKGLTGFDKVTDTNLKELSSNPNSLITRYTLDVVGNKTSGVVDLTGGKAVDLEKILPDSNLKGTGIIKYDIDNGEYYIKKEESEDGTNFKTITLTRTEDKTLTPFQTMLKESKDTKIIARDFTLALGAVKPSGMLTRYFKDTEATTQTKEDFKDIYKELQEKYPRAFIEGNTWAMRNPLEAQELTNTINNFLKNK
tara:strand:+ start:2210 stop:4096 length:1887 start_codon:yes stop_codon:yes gene_type:complete